MIKMLINVVMEKRVSDVTAINLRRFLRMVVRYSFVAYIFKNLSMAVGEYSFII
jgi:hypothetical protein